MSSSFDFTGIGNLCVDIVAAVDESFLDARGFKKGECTYIDLQTAIDTESALVSPAFIAGGSSANSAAGITALGGTAAMLGIIGDDATGKVVRDDCAARNIFLPHSTSNNVSKNSDGSTRIFCLYTPDGERTFASYYGVALTLSPDNLDHDVLRNTRVLNLDGFGLISPRAFETYMVAIEIAHSAGAKVAFNPNDPSVIERNRNNVNTLIEAADIVLCNEREALSLTGEADCDKAIQSLARKGKIVAVTRSELGAVVIHDGSISNVPPPPLPGKLVETNGAGDAFSAGFLYGLIKGKNIVEAATLGCACAGTIITHVGARPILKA